MYTANVNNYRPERTDIKCYTDDKLGNPHYSSRLYKILSHIYDPGEWSVYVDADIFLPEGMEEKLIEELNESGMAVGVFKHPWRDNIFDEAEEVVRLGKDEAKNVTDVMEYYKEHEYERPDMGLAACGVLVRNNYLAGDFNERWWMELCTGSKRDQLSFPIAFYGFIHYFGGNIYDFKKKP